MKDYFSGVGELVELFQQADNRVRRAGATIDLLISAANEQRLASQWEDTLALLRDELAEARVVQARLKGAILGTPTRAA